MEKSGQEREKRGLCPLPAVHSFRHHCILAGSVSIPEPAFIRGNGNKRHCLFCIEERQVTH